MREFLFITPEFRSCLDLLLLCPPLLLLALAGERLSRGRHALLVTLTVGGLVNRWLLAAAAVAALAARWRDAGQPPDPLPAAAAAGNAPSKPGLVAARLVLALLILLIANSLLCDAGDTWWWLNEGRVIARHGLNDGEWFTATIPDTVVPPNEWLSALLAYRLYNHLGWPGLRLFGMLCAALPAWLLFARAPLSARLAFAAVFGWFVLRDEFSLRAVLTTLPLLALAQWQAAAARRALPAALGFALLVALWANLHLSFFIALLFPAARLAAGLALPRGARRFDRCAAAMLAAAALGACLHPLGPGVYGALARMLASEGTVVLDIFRPPDFAEPAFLPALLWCALVLYALRDSPPATRLASVALLIAFLGARRNLLFFVPATLPLFAVATGSRRGIFRALAVAVMVVGICCVACGKPAQPGNPAQAAAFAWLAENAPDGEPVLNHYVLGGRLGWHAFPRRLVFIDGRNHLFEPTRVWRDYLAVHFLDPGFPSVLAHYGFKYALWPEQHPVARALRARGWREIITADGVTVLRAPEK